MCPGYFNFKHSNSDNVSTELCPLSTKSPKKTYDVLGGHPPTFNRFSRSKNCPWRSPTTVTGLNTGWTFDSSINSSDTY
jgi:hypothetical protein